MEAGLYAVQLADGSAADTLTIFASTYVGTEQNGFTCKTCHNNADWDFKYDKWQQTGHAMIFEEGLNGTLSNHYGESCISCHTTGYDPDASNSGFDDFGFVFPDSLYPGVFDQMVSLYPDAMARGEIQCEACHGPGQDHMNSGGTTEFSISDNIGYENCAYCHDDGHYHINPSQWQMSVHAAGTHLYAGASRFSCTPCHNGKGFIDEVKGNPQSVTEIYTINCAACHDPHDATNTHQVRTVSATLENGFVFDMGGAGGLCASCHHSRENAVPYVEDYLNELSRFGPHHGPQSDVLAGTNVYTWGQALETSPHLEGTENACVDCHMSPNAIGEEHIPSAGGHTFSMVNALGEDNVAACEPCHGNFGTEFSDKKFYYNGNADLDGDGVAQGLQLEIQGLMDTLIAHLPPIGSGSMPIDSSWTQDQAAAYYNLATIEEDRSMGIHNPKFVAGLLYLSITKVGGPVLGVENSDNGIPTEFALDQNYPNPFNPSTTINYSVPEQSNVSIVIYDAIGNQVEVLYDGFSAAGNYTLEWNARNYASGVYFYRMQAGNFMQVKKMLLMK
jgi:hypothetical protein